jgi:hypothetical protein
MSEEIKEPQTDFAKLFEAERAEWKEKIQIIGLHIKNIRTVADAQIDLFTSRQVLLEYSFKLAQILSKLASKEKKEKAKKLREYSEKSDVRYGANEKTALIEGDLADLYEKIQLIDSHRKFIDQTMQTVDHMLYSIKTRVALEEYMRGGTVR